MPVPNDLSQEEEDLFSQHGVAPAGQGSEPTGEPSPPADGSQPRDAQGRFVAQEPVEPAAPAAPAPAEPSPDPAASTGQQPASQAPVEAPEPPPAGFVPQQALHAEREANKELKRQMHQLMLRTNQVLASRQPTVEPLPDLQSDPAGFLAAIGDRVVQTEEQRQQAEIERGIDSALSNDERTFAAYTPDYDEATEHYLRSRATELAHMGITGQQAAEVLTQEARTLARQAWAVGQSAAERIYNMAQARGFVPHGLRSAPPVNPQAPQAPAAPAVPAAPSLDAVRAAKAAASRSLSNANGATPVASLNAEALLSMSDEDFERALGLGTKGADGRFASVNF